MMGRIVDLTLILWNVGLLAIAIHDHAPIRAALCGIVIGMCVVNSAYQIVWGRHENS